MLTPEEASLLHDAAVAASENAYAPYSRFPVGAAVMSQAGNIYMGNNVENASYGLSICAERVAIGSMIAAGEQSLKAIAVHCSAAEAAPCGACRQVIIEFSDQAIVVLKLDGELTQVAISELLPHAFTRKALL